LVLDQVAERGHRRAVEAGAQAMVDVFDRAAAVEPPVFVQVGRKDGMAGVVLECGRRRTVTAPLIAMALAAADGIVELATDYQRFGARAAARRTAKLDRLRPLRRVGEERRECLEVRQHVPP